MSDAAREEAERAYPHSWAMAQGFVDGVEWQASRTLPSVEDVARTILMVTQAADVDPDYAWSVQYPEVQEECMDQARAVLALFPGRTEREVKAEAWDEGVMSGLDTGLTIAEGVHSGRGVLDLKAVPPLPANPYRDGGA